MITRVYARSLWFSFRNNIFDIHDCFRHLIDLELDGIRSSGRNKNLGYNSLFEILRISSVIIERYI